jgi:hypothetical protein
MYETRRSNIDSPITEGLRLLTNDAIATVGGHPWQYAGRSAYGRSNMAGVTKRSLLSFPRSWNNVQEGDVSMGC